MKAVTAGEATSKGKNGADWWLANYQNLPPYYLTEKQAKALGWKPKRGNLSVVAPGRMVAMGEYGNRDGHLPAEDGRIWFEADIDYVSGWRNDHRIIFSNDGLIFVSYDHYQTFIEIVSEGIKK